MAAKNPLTQILERLDTIDKKLSSLPKIQKDIAAIKKDIEIIKECVPFENAQEFPNISGGRKSSPPMAASGKH